MKCKKKVFFLKTKNDGLSKGLLEINSLKTDQISCFSWIVTFFWVWPKPSEGGCAPKTDSITLTGLKIFILTKPSQGASQLLSGQHTQNYTNLKSFSTQKMFLLAPSEHGDFDFSFIKDGIVKASTKTQCIFMWFQPKSRHPQEKQLLPFFWTHFEIIEIPLEVWWFL